MPAEDKGKGVCKKKDRPYVYGVVGLAATCFVLGCILVSSFEVNTMASVSATRSLITGEARTYGEEQRARFALLNDPEIKRVEMYALTVKPHLLYFDSDLDWSDAQAHFFGKESVTVIDR